MNLRSLIAELRPAALDELGLDAAIATLSERSGAAAGIEVETQIDLRNGGTARLAPDTETTVYRLVQEALSNAARHSGGSLIRVEVAEGDDAVVVLRRRQRPRLRPRGGRRRLRPARDARARRARRRLDVDRLLA